MFPTLQAASCIAGEFFTAVNSLEVCKGMEQFFAKKDEVLGRWNYEIA